MNVHDFLEFAESQPWRWGGGATGFDGHDCTLFAAGWALMLTGRDPGIGIRGTYSTADEALAIVARAGGVEAFVDQQLRPHGWIRVSAEPQEGDIGVVLAPLLPVGQLGPVPAIRAGGLWVGRSRRGQVARDFKALSTWRWNGGRVEDDLGPPPPQTAVPMPGQQWAGGPSPSACQMQQTGILETVFLSALTTIGVSAPALNYLVPLLSALTTTAVMTGLQLALMPKPPRPADGKVPKTQAVPPVHFGWGRRRLAGAYVLWEERDSYLCGVIALAGHRISGVNQVYLHDDIVTIGPDSFVQEGDDGRYGGDNIWLETRLGAVPETHYSRIVSRLSADGVWTSNHRGDGTASLGFECGPTSQENFAKRYPHGAPQPSADVDLAPVWDVRDPAQSPDDPATWRYYPAAPGLPNPGENPVLCLIHWLCFSPYGPRWDHVKAILPVLERWREEADICDEPVALASGGFEPRYTLDGWATTETDPIGILNQFLAACDGHLAQHGDGTLVLTVGKFREALVEDIHDADIVGHDVQYDGPEEDEINRLVPRFPYPATDYAEAVTDYFESVPDQIKVGRVLPQAAEYMWVTRWRTVRRLALREWKRLQQKKSGSFDLRLSAVNAIHARWVQVNAPHRLPRLDGRIVENQRSILSLMQGGYQMQWRLHPDDIDAWNPATDEGSAPPVPARPTRNQLTRPTIDSATAISNGSTVYLRVVIAAPADAGVTPAVFHRIKDVGGGVPGAWIEQRFPDAPPPVAGLVTLNTNPVPGNTVLQVEAAVIGSGGTYSDRSTPPLDVVTTTDPTPPGEVSGLTATPGAGQVAFAWQTPASANFVKVQIWRATVNDPGAASLVRTEYGLPDKPDSWTDTGLAAGTYYYWVHTVNSGGTPSAGVATGAKIVT